MVLTRLPTYQPKRPRRSPLRDRGVGRIPAPGPGRAAADSACRTPGGPSEGPGSRRWCGRSRVTGHCSRVSRAPWHSTGPTSSRWTPTAFVLLLPGVEARLPHFLQSALSISGRGPTEVRDCPHVSSRCAPLRPEPYLRVRPVTPRGSSRLAREVARTGLGGSSQGRRRPT